MVQLVDQGWQVNVICGFTASPADNPSKRLETWQGVSINRCGLRVDHKANFALRAISYGSFLLMLFVKLLFHDKNRVWFGVTNPPFNAWILALVSKLRNKQFIYMFQDIQPEGLIALGKLNKANIVARCWIFLNRLSYRRADQLIILGRDMVPLLQNMYGLEKSKFSYLPHWGPLAIDRPKEFSQSSKVKDLGLQDKFVVQYSGNMGLWHDMDSFVAVAKQLEHHEDIIFTFIGDGIRRQQAEKLAAKNRAKNIIWLNFVPGSELEDSLAACHVSLISLRDNLEGVAVPCKLYGILSSGRPVLAQVPENSEVAFTVLENDCGVVVMPGDTEGLCEAIVKLRNERETGVEMGKRAFDAYQRLYTLDRGGRNFTRIITANQR